jgi:pimeloyl-ACP methyl ester carboxylesterase
MSTTILECELEQVVHANATRRQPVVFVHGLWLLPSSWDRWMERFEEAGYATLSPGWPDDPTNSTIGEIADHYDTIVGRLHKRPAIVGHSYGALITEILAGRGCSAVSVAISPAPFQPLPLTFDQFRFAFANAVSEREAQELYEAFSVPGSGVPNSSLEGNPDRGPMLVVAAEMDRTVTPTISKAAYEIESRNAGVTEYTEMPGRGHSLTIDHGWSDVADLALSFVQRFAPAAVRV